MPINFSNLHFRKVIIALSLTIYAGCAASIKQKKTGEEKTDETTNINVTVKGKITSHNKQNVLKGAYVYVYKDNSTEFKDSPFLISEPTDENGEFSLTIPSGKYYLVARKFLENTPKISDLKMKVNEYYCYYGGNPVAIFQEPFFIGLNCSQITKEETIEPVPSTTGNNKQSGIKGTITFDGAPLSDAYVFVYNNSNSDFKGPYHLTFAASDETGQFKIDIPPGNYYLLMKKKKNANPSPSSTANIFQEGKDPKGNIVGGPLSHNDYFYYYHNNPISVSEGNYININIPAINKLGEDNITHYNYVTPTRVEGMVKDVNQNPVKGIRVFAFRRIIMGVEKPAFMSTITKEDGKYVINFTEHGLFYLVARDAIGRPVRHGDMFGYYFGTEDHSIIVKKNTVLTNIDLKVWKTE